MTKKEEIAYLKVLHKFSETVSHIDEGAESGSYSIKKIQELLLRISDAYITLLEA